MGLISFLIDRYKDIRHILVVNILTFIYTVNDKI